MVRHLNTSLVLSCLKISTNTNGMALVCRRLGMVVVLSQFKKTFITLRNKSAKDDAQNYEGVTDCDGDAPARNANQSVI